MIYISYHLSAALEFNNMNVNISTCNASAKIQNVIKCIQSCIARAGMDRLNIDSRSFLLWSTKFSSDLTRYVLEWTQITNKNKNSYVLLTNAAKVGCGHCPTAKKLGGRAAPQPPPRFPRHWTGFQVMKHKPVIDNAYSKLTHIFISFAKQKNPFTYHFSRNRAPRAHPEAAARKMASWKMADSPSDVTNNKEILCTFYCNKSSHRTYACIRKWWQRNTSFFQQTCGYKGQLLPCSVVPISSQSF